MLPSEIRYKFGSEALHTQNTYFDLVFQGPDLETSDKMIHQQHIIHTDNNARRKSNTNQQNDTLNGSSSTSIALVYTILYKRPPGENQLKQILINRFKNRTKKRKRSSSRTKELDL